ncbi:MAG: bifunctional pyr operon transcriptional regulator/uracil phosphoribosyltransferase PyrR [Dinghuibacter sp.]|nr:bifunctional pyr operon transcriptional regulator/uracil phosphoribosyltransferase PyrR [Dinghuibacter sp.]
MKQIYNKEQLSLTLHRLAHQLLENHPGLANTVIIGLQPRGILLSDRLVNILREIDPAMNITYGKLDITFYRDDVRNELHMPNKTDIPFSLASKNVILVDDVLFTGRTIRAALDALLGFGRPAKVELCVLINRRYSRELPIQPDYTGKTIDAFVSQKVKMRWAEKDGVDEVYIEGSLNG